MKSASSALHHFVALKRTLFRSEILLASNKHCRKDSIASPPPMYRLPIQRATVHYRTPSLRIQTIHRYTRWTPPYHRRSFRLGFTCDRGTVTPVSSCFVDPQRQRWLAYALLGLLD